jgi:hypothetical protein
MTTDSINDEILRIKRELAGRFGNDLDLIIADAKSRERNTVSFLPRRWKSEQSDAPNPPNDTASIGASSPAAG